MGRKVNPKGFRLGKFYTWDSRWFADKKRYRDLLLEDQKIRDALMAKLRQAGIAKVEIERSINTLDVTLNVSRPGMVIGRGGQGLEDLKRYVEDIIKKQKATSATKVELHVEPVKEPNLEAQLIASMIADQLVRRMPYKRVIAQTMEKVMGSQARGVKIILAGRIAGAEIARRERYQQGAVPLSTLREKIDFARVAALTKSGFIGVKVWICRP